jgi:hypothetical protein
MARTIVKDHILLKADPGEASESSERLGSSACITHNSKLICALQPPTFASS